MTLWIAVAGCAVCVAAALLPTGRGLFLAAAAVGTVGWAGAAWEGGWDAAQPLTATCVFLAAVLVRRSRQDRRRVVQLLASERAARAAQVEAAGARERARIARDLHDGLSHLLTSQLLVLRTADVALADGDAALGADRVREAVRISRESLVEARDVVEVLRGRPPDLALVRSTVEDWAAASGRPVALALPDSDPALTGSAWGVVLATLRESLTNAARHSREGEVRVELDTRPGAGATRVELVVTSAGTDGAALLPAGGGTGLQGLRERAALADGSLCAGPEGTGWQVVLTLPVGGAR